jgi:hypothetical protein
MQRAQCEERRFCIPVKHADVAGTPLKDAGVALADAGAHGLDLIRSLGQHVYVTLFLIPAEAGDVEAVAVHNSGLYGWRGAGKATSPGSYRQPALGQDPPEVRHVASGKCLNHMVVRQPVNLDDEETAMVVWVDGGYRRTHLLLAC